MKFPHQIEFVVVCSHPPSSPPAPGDVLLNLKRCSAIGVPLFRLFLSFFSVFYGPFGSLHFVCVLVVLDWEGGG